MKFLLAILPLWLWHFSTLPIMGEGRPVDHSHPLESGDVILGKTYDATFTGDGFQIQTKDKEQTFQVKSLSPVYSAQWTTDSKTLCTVEHLAGGSNAVCFHYDAEGKTWFRMNLRPPGGPYKSYQVSQWDVGETDVQITYSASKQRGIAPASVGLKVDASLFVAFAGKLRPQMQMNKMNLAGTLNATNAAQLQNITPLTVGPIKRDGILAIDTDGTTNDHHDIPANHQNYCSAMKDANGNLVPRKTEHGHLPAGCSDLSADHFSYAVAPSNLAEINGGTLKVGDKIDIILDGVTHTTVLADFGPDGKNGEASCHEIYEIGCDIRDLPDGPIPLHNNSDLDIPVKVVYYPSP